VRGFQVTLPALSERSVSEVSCATMICVEKNATASMNNNLYINTWVLWLEGQDLKVANFQPIF